MLMMILACTSDDDGDEVVDTGTTADLLAFSISGNAVDFDTNQPKGPGLCVEALDPTNAITGGDPTVLGTAMTSPAGDYVLTDITEKPALGILVSIKDCEGEASTVLETATGVNVSAYTSIEDGGVIPNVKAWSISNSTRDEINTSAAKAGWTKGPVEEVGLLVSHIWLDGSEDPIDDAQMICGCGDTFLYMDGDASDGLFTTGGKPNTSTSVEGRGVAMLPAAPVYTYEAEHTDYTFETLTAGSQEGMALFISMDGI